MKSLLMNYEFNHTQNLISSLENELDILEALEKLMMQDEQLNSAPYNEHVKEVQYRKTA